MVGSDSDPQNYPETHFFLKGTEVEVSSDEDGFRGAWYTATIAESPYKSASSKKRKKALIEYKTLVTDDGSTPLTEHVDFAYIRPLPPQQEQFSDTSGARFEENDVVDAGYRDGWWMGTVSKVLEGSRYRVYFDNPPDVIEFDAKDLRVHWDWVNGNWVRTGKKQQTTGSVFSPGTDVEVNLDKENGRDAWFPAVVIKEHEDQTFLVKCQSSKNIDEAGTAKVIVDSFHIRPIPPRFADRNYELLEKVDTPYDFGWRAGVITKVLAGGRYNVFFKQGSEDKELNQFEIRPHIEWVDGRWLNTSKEVMVFSDRQEELVDTNNINCSRDVTLQVEGLGAAEDKNMEKTHSAAGIGNLMEQSTNGNEKAPSHTSLPSKIKRKLAAPNGDGMLFKKLAEGDGVESPLSVTAPWPTKLLLETPIKERLHSLSTPKTGRKRTSISRKLVVSRQSSAETESLSAGKEVKPKQQKVGALFCQKVDFVTRKGRHIKSPFKTLQASVAVKERNALDAAGQNINESEVKTREAEVPVILGLEAKGVRSSQLPDQETLKLKRDQKKNLNDSVGSKIMELNQPKGEGSSQKRKRGRPRKLMVIHSKASEAVPQDAPREKTAELSQQDCTTKEVNMAIVEVSKNMADDDQPLSMWFGGMHTSTSVEELRLSSGRSANGWNEARERHADLAMESSVIDAKGNILQDGDEGLPFVKRSQVWKTIESMEVFQIVPQKPHFLPLNECKEEYREGSAIGIMVTFASLFDRISSLQFNDSRGILESILESLLDLEKHGFDVTMPRGRVNELLSIKDGQGELLNESKDAERQIREHTGEVRNLDEKINGIVKKITVLQEELATYKLEMKAKDLEIARLRSHVDGLNGCISKARHEFEKVATAPWKLP